MHPARKRPILRGSLLRAGLLVLLAGLAGLLAPSARAEAVPVAVLGLDAVDVPPEEALQLTEALRRRLGTVPGVRLVPGKDLVELKLVFGCMDERPACLAQAGRSLGAERLIYGSIRKPAAGAGHTVVLKQLWIPEARIEKFISDTVPVKLLTGGPRRGEPDELTELLGRWLGVLVAANLTGGLEIATDPPGAEVILDGKPAGVTPLRLSDVATGTHVARLALPGYDQVVRSFTVRGGLVHQLTAQLRPRGQAAPPERRLPLAGAAPGAPAQATADRGRPLRIASYFLIGAAALAGGVSLYTWRTYSDEQDHTGNAARELKAALDMSSLTWPASPEVNAFFQSSERLSSCQPPQELTVRAMANPMTQAAFQSYLDHCRRGRTYTDTTTGLVATMGSLALAGVTSYILGRTLGSRRPRAEDPYQYKAEGAGKQSWLYRPRLTEITPAANASGGGLNLSFEF